MFWRIVLICLVVYLAYKVIFELMVPLFRATRKIKKDFREMQDRMNEFMQNQQQGYTRQPDSKTTAPKNDKPGDYIDFEEIK